MRIENNFYNKPVYKKREVTTENSQTKELSNSKQYDKVSISSKTLTEEEMVKRAVKQLKSELEQYPSKEKLEGLKMQIKEGTYKVDPEEIAKLILK